MPNRAYNSSLDKDSVRNWRKLCIFFGALFVWITISPAWAMMFLGTLALSKVLTAHKNIFRTGHAILSVFVGALAVQVYFLLFAKLSLSATDRLVSFSSMVLLPTIVIVPWRMIQKRLGPATNVPIGAGGMIFFCLAAIFVNVATWPN